MATPSGHHAFQIAVVTSLTVHSLLFLRGPGALRHERRPQPETTRPLQLALAAMHTESSQPLPITFPSVIREAERPAPAASWPPTGGEARLHMAERAERPSLPVLMPETPAPQSRPNKPAVPAIIDLSDLSEELGREPSYLQYFRAIRERIRYYAQRNSRQMRRGGEVFLQFVLSAAGQLQAVEVDTARSVHDVALERLSLGSVRQAAPFPPFPATFNQPQITFRIIVQYEAD